MLTCLFAKEKLGIAEVILRQGVQIICLLDQKDLLKMEKRRLKTAARARAIRRRKNNVLACSNISPATILYNVLVLLRMALREVILQTCHIGMLSRDIYLICSPFDPLRIKLYGLRCAQETKNLPSDEPGTPPILCNDNLMGEGIMVNINDHYE